MKFLNFKKIVIIGNSKKFIFQIKKNFKYELLDIIPWRKINYFSYKKKNIYSLIFICGFDFGTYKKNYILFKKKNIYEPLKILRQISDKNTKIVYINTQNYNSNNYTFSRYKFAKQKLSYLLYRNFKNLVVINSDLITLKQSISINSKTFSRYLFLIFVKLGFLKTVEIKKIFFEVKRKLENKFYQKQNNIRGYLLYLPRSQFVDRFLRIF